MAVVLVSVPQAVVNAWRLVVHVAALICAETPYITRLGHVRKKRRAGRRCKRVRSLTIIIII